MLQTPCLKLRIFVQNYDFLAFWLLILTFRGWQLWSSTEIPQWLCLSPCTCILTISSLFSALVVLGSKTLRGKLSIWYDLNKNCVNRMWNPSGSPQIIFTLPLLLFTTDMTLALATQTQQSSKFWRWTWLFPFLISVLLHKTWEFEQLSYIWQYCIHQ